MTLLMKQKENAQQQPALPATVPGAGVEGETHALNDVADAQAIVTTEERRNQLRAGRYASSRGSGEGRNNDVDL